MSQFPPVDDVSMMFDPQYQNNLFLIEEALQETGVLPPARDPLPDVYDKQLRALIDSVPLG